MPNSFSIDTCDTYDKDIIIAYNQDNSLLRAWEGFEEWIIVQLGRNLQKTLRSYHQVSEAKILLYQHSPIGATKNPEDARKKPAVESKIWKTTGLRLTHFFSCWAFALLYKSIFKTFRDRLIEDGLTEFFLEFKVLNFIFEFYWMLLSYHGKFWKCSCREEWKLNKI